MQVSCFLNYSIVVRNIISFPSTWGNDLIWLLFWDMGWFNHQLLNHPASFGKSSSLGGIPTRCLSPSEMDSDCQEMSSREFLLGIYRLSSKVFCWIVVKLFQKKRLETIYDSTCVWVCWEDKKRKEILWVDWGPDNDLWSPGSSHL